jgi:hypothetical protein
MQCIAETSEIFEGLLLSDVVWSFAVDIVHNVNAIPDTIWDERPTIHAFDGVMTEKKIYVRYRIQEEFGEHIMKSVYDNVFGFDESCLNGIEFHGEQVIGTFSDSLQSKRLRRFVIDGLRTDQQKMKHFLMMMVYRPEDTVTLKIKFGYHPDMNDEFWVTQAQLFVLDVEFIGSTFEAASKTVELISGSLSQWILNPLGEVTNLERFLNLALCMMWLTRRVFEMKLNSVQNIASCLDEFSVPRAFNRSNLSSLFRKIKRVLHTRPMLRRHFQSLKSRMNVSYVQVASHIPRFNENISFYGNDFFV